jgi:hypothetical protein
MLGKRDGINMKKIPRLKKVQYGRHTRKAQLTDKNGSVKASLAFFCFYGFTTLSVGGRKCRKDCVENKLHV